MDDISTLGEPYWWFGTNGNWPDCRLRDVSSFILKRARILIYQCKRQTTVVTRGRKTHTHDSQLPLYHPCHNQPIQHLNSYSPTILNIYDNSIKYLSEYEVSLKAPGKPYFCKSLNIKPWHNPSIAPHPLTRAPSPLCPQPERNATLTQSGKRPSRWRERRHPLPPNPSGTNSNAIQAA